jgi:hypothetical protein
MKGLEIKPKIHGQLTKISAPTIHNREKIVSLSGGRKIGHPYAKE